MLRLRHDLLLFPEGKEKALTFSFDDGVTQDATFIEMLNRYKLKGTFNINSGLCGKQDWLSQPGIEASHYKHQREEIAEVYQGHEVAVHSLTHMDLTTIPVQTAAYEILTDKENLEEIIKRPVRGMAYPFGTWNERVIEVLKFCGVSYSRTTNQTLNFGLPEDFLAWHPTCHYREVIKSTELQKKFQQKKKTYQGPDLFYVWGHSYEFDAFNDWVEIEKFLREIAGQEDIWYASNIEIFDYVTAYRSLLYSASGRYIENQSNLDVWMMIEGLKYCLKKDSCTTIPD